MKIEFDDKFGDHRTICYLEEELPNADPRAVIAAFYGLMDYTEAERETLFATIKVIDDESIKMRGMREEDNL